MRFNLHELSRHTGHTVHLIRQHIAAGCPVEVVGDLSRNYQIDFSKYIEWFIAYRVGETDSEQAKFKTARAKRLNSEAERMENELAALALDTVTIAESRALVEHYVTTAHAHARKYPVALKAALEAMKRADRQDPYSITIVLADTMESIFAGLRNDPSEAEEPMEKSHA